MSDEIEAKAQEIVSRFRCDWVFAENEIEAIANVATALRDQHATDAETIRKLREQVQVDQTRLEICYDRMVGCNNENHGKHGLVGEVAEWAKDAARILTETEDKT